MKKILCLSNEPWSTSPGRTQQLLSRLRETQILYFSPSPQGKMRLPMQKGRKVRPNVTEYTLPPPLFRVEEKYVHLFRLEQRRLATFITQVAQRHRFGQALLWTCSPEHVHLLDQLPYDGLVYDCDREWDELPPHWEGSLANMADVVFAASPLLVDRLSPCSGNIALLPNGVNYPLFSNQTASPRPDPLPRVPGPILGWTGTIGGDLDLSPILHAAQERPGWRFVLLGPQESNPLLPKLRRLSNVILPGSCPLSEVPDWLYRCDVLLELLRYDRPYSDVISPRLYEYLATGKPVVSMLWPDQVELFPDVVYAAATPQEFVTLCQHALDEAPGFVAQRRQDHAAAASWPHRAGQVAHILDTAGLL